MCWCGAMKPLPGLPSFAFPLASSTGLGATGAGCTAGTGGATGSLGAGLGLKGALGFHGAELFNGIPLGFHGAGLDEAEKELVGGAMGSGAGRAGG
jgi:hypothetical protein